jgi:signal transduction histidine kinase/Fe-S-cluster-containing hydrogenase component 2
MGVITTIPEKCKRCYSCVRECPARAIKVESGQAMVVEERCIACGSCVRVCAQHAKRIEDATAHVKRMLREEPGRAVAALAPSFPAAFHWVRPGQVVKALRELGFAEVWDVAFGAELVSKEYERCFAKARRTGQRIITTPCPAVVEYVEKYLPSLRDLLAPIVSPMIAIAKAVKKTRGPGARVVFIGPCTAKKKEIQDPAVAGVVDAVLTYREALALFQDAGIELPQMAHSGLDGPRSYLARSFPISGGLLKSAGLSMDILENGIVVTEGKERVLSVLREIAAGKSRAQLFDLLFCEGCINGPKMPNELSMFARKEIIAEYVNEQIRYTTQKQFVEAIEEYDGLDLRRTFAAENLVLPEPPEERVDEILRRMKKLAPEDRLNCGACGYPTCRDKAVAVGQGLAEAEMCLPYLIDELEETLANLHRSHEELTQAQARLVQSERLASMGQLSAGVAHEINNPLGTILVFSHMLLKQLRSGDPIEGDLRMIVSEANRCRTIVRGLLDFARQSRVQKAETDIAEIVDEVVAVARVKGGDINVDVEGAVEPGLPLMMVDAGQVKQMLVNLVENAVDAVRGRPDARVRMEVARGGAGEVVIRVADNGCGIPREHLAKVFTPFFTTKEMGKGTGLGLAITYGIVKMHSGQITVDSEVGKGTTFAIRLPVGRPGGPVDGAGPAEPAVAERSTT